MRKPVPGPDDLTPDGVRIIVQWDDFRPNASVFVPCINTKKAEYQVERLALRKGWSIIKRNVIEQGMSGVRFWRLS